MFLIDEFAYCFCYNYSSQSGHNFASFYDSLRALLHVLARMVIAVNIFHEKFVDLDSFCVLSEENVSRRLNVALLNLNLL